MSKKIVFSCDSCSADIAQYHHAKSLAMVGNAHGPTLSFGAWGDKEAELPRVLHFCSDRCGEQYLRRWLDEQRIPEEIEPVQIPPKPTELSPPESPSESNETPEPLF